jgi:tetratricopeptide (TPR) repeat protein
LPTFNWAGYVTPREWYAGLIAAGLGDAARAQKEFEAAHRFVAEILAARPDDAKAYIVQAEITARMAGRKAEAIAAGEHALALRPVAKDAVDGVHIMGRLAGVYAQVGETDRALQLLETAVKAPNGPNYGSLQLEETWDPLRSNPRFVKIVATVAP